MKFFFEIAMVIRSLAAVLTVVLKTLEPAGCFSAAVRLQDKVCRCFPEDFPWVYEVPEIVDSGPIPDLRRHLEVVTLTAIMAMPTPAQRVHVAVAVSELLDGMMEGMADGVVLEF